MATYIAFNEGKSYLGNNGLPATCYFLLSTRGVQAGTQHTAADTLAGGIGEITGTGYGRATEAEPSGASGVFAFAVKTFQTLTAADWPASVRSIVLVTSPDNSGKAIMAWDLQTSGAARDFSKPNTTETFTPTLTLS